MELNLNKKFPSKILLFGEHLINIGSSALSIPFHRYSGQIALANSDESSLDDFINFLKSTQFDFLDNEKLEKLPVLNFKSDIPIGYGCGSSGAIVAACYDLLRLDDLSDVEILKNRFSKMESFYHGKSSGTDPLVIYLDKAIKFSSHEGISILPSFNPNLPTTSLHLLDSDKERDGKVYIKYFMNEIKDPAYKDLLDSQLVPAMEASISSLLENDEKTLIQSFKTISHFQLKHMEYLIPKSLKSMWEDGLHSNSYYIKLCGAGGGGFFVCLSCTRNKPNTEHNYLSIF